MEFTMVTPLGDSAPNGKENQPNIQSLSLAQNKMKAGKSIFLDKSKMKKGNTSPVESGEMNQAFDRLLVRVFVSVSMARWLTVALVGRTTCKFHLH